MFPTNENGILKMGKEIRQNRRLFRDAILEGNFDEAQQLYKKIYHEDARDELIKILMDDHNILAYGFVCVLIETEKTAEAHMLAAEINECACEIPGAYELAYYHTRKAVEIDPVYKSALLYFNDIPDKLLDNESAIRIAKEVLEGDPKNETAIRTLNWLLEK